MYDKMAAEEIGHRDALLALYRTKFGEFLPLIRRQDVKGFVDRKPVWLVRPLGINTVRRQAETMELETRRVYERAQRQAERIQATTTFQDEFEEDEAF